MNEREIPADELTEALDALADPATAPGVRLGAAGIARHEVERLREDIERLADMVATLTTENMQLRPMEQRARNILAAGIEWDPAWRRAARHILRGEAS